MQMATQPNYNQVFASAASTGELLSWQSTNYLRGWGYLGQSEPPPMEFFNSLQNLSDLKSQYLFKAGNIRESKVYYNVGDVVTSPNLPSKYYLVCTRTGTSGENEPSLSTVEQGESVSDGSCTWQIRSKISSGVVMQSVQPNNQSSGDVWIEVE